MRLLLDENVPAKLTRFFAPEMQATTVARRGWSGIKNSELMRLAQHEFDVLVTMDRGIPHQQNLEEVDLAISSRIFARSSGRLIRSETSASLAAFSSRTVRVEGVLACPSSRLLQNLSVWLRRWSGVKSS